MERRPSRAPADLEIAVLRLPSLSNFSDLDPLEAEASIRLRWISPGEPLGHPDAVILPGSKQTLNDLALLREGGLSDQLKLYANSGGNLLGLCGGLQMLGRQLDDPEQLEGGPTSSEEDCCRSRPDSAEKNLATTRSRQSMARCCRSVALNCTMAAPWPITI